MRFQTRTADPGFPPEPGLTRTVIGQWVVDYEGGTPPTLAEVQAQAAPTAQQLANNLRQQAMDQFLNDGSPLARVTRALALTMKVELNKLRTSELVGVAQATWDPPSVANGAGVTSPGVAVAGASFGDVVDVAAPYSLQGLTATAYVSAAGTVVVRLHNGTGAAVNLGSGAWGVAVRRARPEYSDQDLLNAVTAQL